MVAIVTDSVADIPVDVAKDLNITVVPLSVQFGEDTYRDGIDMTYRDFYTKLKGTTVLPKTSAPSPGYFASVFDDLAAKNTGILGIFLSRKLSATYEAAADGAKLMKQKCRVEIFDSASAIMGQGLLVIEAARQAMSGVNLSELVEITRRTMSKVHFRATLDTLKYVAMGGRIGKAQAMLGSLLNINPILGIKDGLVFPYTKVRSRAKATEWLFEFTTKFSKVNALAVEHGMNVDEANALVKRLASRFPNVPIYLSNISPVIGTHAGPNVLSVAVLEE